VVFLTEVALKNLGFNNIGDNVLISDKASIYGAENVSIGDNVRIDDFCILSAIGGYIDLGSHIHIAAYVSLFGGGGIVIEDFCGVSSYTCIYSVNDNYNGDYLMGPEIDSDLTDVTKAEVRLCRYVTCGTHSVVLPGVRLNEGTVLGACSLATKEQNEWQIYAGVPAKEIKARKRGLLSKAKEMEKRWQRKS